MIPVILSGGSGTRLWPVSRASYPKQFCDFFDGSFLGNTIDRLKVLGEVHVLTTKGMEALTRRAVSREGLKAENVIYEPMGKNTAPAVALLCHFLDTRGKGDEIAGVFPSDHLIGNEEEFHKAVRLAESIASQGYVVTLGVQPSSPATGYGYIEVTPESIGSSDGLKAHRVAGFREKPNLATAKTYLDSGRHFWNAGMFVFRVCDMIAHFQKFQPQLWSKIAAINADMSNAQYNYALVDSISLDYAIMEKLDTQACVPCDMEWSDVGSWDEMARLSEESEKLQSTSRAEVFNVNSENNYVYSVNNKVIGLIDVTDTMVVDTPDALLVVRKGSSQKVKELVDAMREAGQSEATEHPFETRPWGRFEILADDKHYKAKKITVDPGAQLSYQSHAQRSEHWVVISGQGEVVLNEKTIALKPGESVYIPEGSKHRMRNPGAQPLIFVEVQTGKYFGEDDIVRYQDDYSRVQN
ncbi:MAG: mannose-1-phosphate guanylyltransferase/mannose-6-phosphate isomerase [Bdellovibrionales bacterium]|nr:mannose-1-phosphate guanylyltransferase/mannose-6-phosphate isomerase [Bdellovibrionales bacterium]